jgi:hypothetical protein
VRRERCQPTRREWALITSSRPVVRRGFRSAPLWEAGTPMTGEAPDVTPCRGREPMHGARAPLFLPAESNKCSPMSEGGQS